MEFPVNRRKADVVILKQLEGIPILVIETKRKTETISYWSKEERRFDP